MSLQKEHAIKNNPVIALDLLNKQIIVITELKELLREADEYLDTNNLTSIGHGSILHQKIKDIL